MFLSLHVITKFIMFNEHEKKKNKCFVNRSNTTLEILIERLMKEGKKTVVVI